jgi:sec-independent protein translocase protein TatB
MFDLSWGHMAIVALVALLVLGPKELPNALRTASSWMRAARKLAGEFQSGVNEIIREADLEDARKQISGLNTETISKHIENTIDPTGEIKASLTVDEPKGDSAAGAATPPAATSLTTGQETAGQETTEPETAAIEASPAAADFHSAPTLPPNASPSAAEERKPEPVTVSEKS